MDFRARIVKLPVLKFKWVWRGRRRRKTVIREKMHQPNLSSISDCRKRMRVELITKRKLKFHKLRRWKIRRNFYKI